MKTTIKSVYSLIAAIVIISASLDSAQGQNQSDAASAEIEKWKKEAESANARASLAEEKAKEFQKLADQNAARAIAAAKEANRMRYLAQGKAMAIKSMELGADPEQEALVAQLANKFNTQYGGNPMDNDIYNGLYNALVRLNDKPTQSLKGHEKGTARALVTSVKLFNIFSGGSDGRILRWTLDGTEWKPDSITGKRKDYQVYAIDLSPDGNWLVAGGAASGKPEKNYLELYDLKNPGKAPVKTFGFSEIASLIYSSNGVYVREKSGVSIKFTDFKTVREVIKPKEVINAIAMSQDGSRLAGAGTSGTLYVWDINKNFEEKMFYKNAAEITAVTFAPDNRRIVIGDTEGHVKVIWDVNLQPMILTGHKAYIEQIVFDHAGHFFATTSRDRSVRLWNIRKLSEQPIVLHDENLDSWWWSAVFTPNDEHLMVGVHPSSARKLGETIHVWPARIASMANSICSHVSRNMTRDEWENFVGDDLDYEKVCENLPLNNK